MIFILCMKTIPRETQRPKRERDVLLQARITESRHRNLRAAAALEGSPPRAIVEAALDHYLKLHFPQLLKGEHAKA